MATDPCTTTFEDLNTDTLLHIYSFVRDKNFKLLSLLARTSRRMKNKLYDPLFWKNAVAEFRYISDETALSLRTRNITKLKLKSSQKVTDLWSSLKICSAVDGPEYIEIKLIERHFFHDRLRNNSINFTGLQNISSLRCLVITVHSLPKKTCNKTTCRFMSGALQALKDLIELVVYYNPPNEFRSGVAESLGYLPKLKTLEIYRSGSLPALPSPRVFGMCSTAEQACYPSIERVAGHLPLTFADLVHTFPNLKQLDLTLQQEVDSNVLDLLHEQQIFLPNISSLELKVEMKSLKIIRNISLALPLFPSLNALSINLYEVTDAQQRDLLLEGVMNCSKQLKVLELGFWGNELVTYTQAASIVYNFKQLEILKFPCFTHLDCGRRQDCIFHREKLYDVLPNLICNGVICGHSFDFS